MWSKVKNQGFNDSGSFVSISQVASSVTEILQNDFFSAHNCSSIIHSCSPISCWASLVIEMLYQVLEIKRRPAAATHDSSPVELAFQAGSELDVEITAQSSSRSQQLLRRRPRWAPFVSLGAATWIGCWKRSVEACVLQFLKDIGLFCKYVPSNRIHSTWN